MGASICAQPYSAWGIQSFTGSSHIEACPCSPQLLSTGETTCASGQAWRSSAGVTTASPAAAASRKSASRNIGPSNHQCPKSSASYGATTSASRSIRPDQRPGARLDPADEVAGVLAGPGEGRLRGPDGLLHARARDAVVLEAGGAARPARPEHRGERVLRQVPADVPVEVAVHRVGRVADVGAPHLLGGLGVAGVDRHARLGERRSVHRQERPRLGVGEPVRIEEGEAEPLVGEDPLEARVVAALGEPEAGGPLPEGTGVLGDAHRHLPAHRLGATAGGAGGTRASRPRRSARPARGRAARRMPGRGRPGSGRSTGPPAAPAAPRRSGRRRSARRPPRSACTSRAASVRCRSRRRPMRARSSGSSSIATSVGVRDSVRRTGASSAWSRSSSSSSGR